MSRRLSIFTGLLLLLAALLCTAARAQSYWVKYQQTSSNPAFTIEYPSGWAVDTTKKVNDYSLGELVFPGKTVLAFTTKANGDQLECGVKKYALPGTAAGSDLLIPMTAVGTTNGMTVAKLHGQEYLEATVRDTSHGRTIWRSFFLGDKTFYMVYMDVPTALSRQVPACRQSYDTMVRSFWAPDWPLKTINQAAAPDMIPITVINNGQHSLYISLTQTGNKVDRLLSVGKQWVANMTKSGCAEFWGFYSKGVMLPHTETGTASETITVPATWTFTEIPSPTPRDPKMIKWSRLVSSAPSAADALDKWVKYVHATPSFSLDMPGGWTVTGGDQADKISSDIFTLTPQAKVSFDYGVKPNLLHAAVTVYTASAKADVAKLQALLAAQPVDKTAALPVRTTAKLTGHDYLLDSSTSPSTFTWNSYLPSDTTVYVLTFQGPTAAMTPSQACYSHMAASFLATNWPTPPPMTTPKPVTTTTPATTTTAPDNTIRK